MENGKIVRTSDSNAQILVKDGKWIFAPKKDWKSQSKDIKGRRKYYVK
jgi:hypothetical protein